MEEKKYNDNFTFDEKVMMAIVRTAENFKRTQSIVFKNYGLSFPQYNILRVLVDSEMGQNKISMVGKIMLTPGANMTGHAKRLEKKGFIERKSDPSDERVTLLSITPKGKGILKEIEGEKDHSLKKILGDFSDESKRKYLKFTKQIIKATIRSKNERVF